MFGKMTFLQIPVFTNAVAVDIQSVFYPIQNTGEM